MPNLLRNKLCNIDFNLNGIIMREIRDHKVIQDPCNVKYEGFQLPVQQLITQL